MNIQKLKTDILIIGGGTAGCYAALTVSKNTGAKVLICEKAHIKRSGCRVICVQRELLPNRMNLLSKRI